MAIEGFDYKKFAELMAEQAEQFAPADLSKKDKEYLVRTMLNFTVLAGEALSNDDSLKLNVEQAEIICQVLSEWTFHKVVDLARSGIKEQHWDSIMQKIAFTLYEVAKQSIQKELPQEQLLQAVEYHVVKAYKESVTELKKKNVITKEIMEKALAQSNIDKLAEESRESNEKIEYTELEEYIPKQSWFDKLKEMFLPHKELKKIEKEFYDVRQEMQDLVNPDKMYERLGVDIISLQVGAGLLSIADPDQDGLLLAKSAALRQRLTDDYGYIIPNVRIMDSSKLEANEYIIAIRDNIVSRGFVYPEKYMVNVNEWNEKLGDIPENAIIGVDPVFQSQAYWVNENIAAENQDKATFTDATDVIIKHLEECVIKHVDKIITDIDVEKYIALVENHNPSQVKYLLEYLSVYDIRKIFVNLIREKVSIKDISFIFMKLCEFVKYSTNVLILSEKLRTALARGICLANVTTDSVLYAVQLSSLKEELLIDSCTDTEMDRMFKLEPNQIQEIVQEIGTALVKAEQNFGKQPVLLVNPKIRYALYYLLVRYIPTIVVLSYTELIPDIKVESFDKIE